MKYALISDVHGNFRALCAVLSDARRANVDKYVFAGDYYMGFPYPNEVVDVIKGCPNSFAVRGNEEDRVEILSGKDRSSWVDGQFQALYWYYNEMSAENKKYLIGLPQSTVIDGCLHVSHRSSDFFGNIEMEKFSTSQLYRLFGDSTPTKSEILAVISDILDGDETFKISLRELEDGMYVFGHSHVQWYKQFGGKHIINPGSCGFPVDFAGGAPYTVLDISNNGISVQERRVMYDETKCVHELLNSSLYKHEKVWNEIIIKEFMAHHEIMMDFLLFVEDYANKTGDSTRPFSKRTWAEAYCAWQRSEETQRF